MMHPVAIYDPFVGPSEGPFEPWLESVLLGNHPLMKAVRSRVVRAAATDLHVFISGPTGTGKEIVARAIHGGSTRGTRKLYVVALAGLRETARSLLFGHKRGAFTGAIADHEGVFGAAHCSTLLFDDIDNTPIELQPMLLRAVQYGAFLRLGETHERCSDVRILATTNAPMEREILVGRFRADLYQRLSVLKIELPPLKDHLDDLDVYVPHFSARPQPRATRPRRFPRRAWRRFGGIPGLGT
jgi:DNA-binding NtrC family response regulator